MNLFLVIAYFTGIKVGQLFPCLHEESFLSNCVLVERRVENNTSLGKFTLLTLIHTRGQLQTTETQFNHPTYHVPLIF